MRRTEQGFTLIELMLVVAIVGILSAMAIPAYTKALAKTRQSEAKDNLSALADAEKAYHLEYNSYGSFTDLNFTLDGNTRYIYCIGSARSTGMVNPTSPGGGGSGSATPAPSATPLGGTGIISPGGPIGGGGGGGGGGGVDPFGAPPGGTSGVLGRLFFGPGAHYHGLPLAILVPMFAQIAPAAGASVCGGNPYYDFDSFEADARGVISRAPAPNDVDLWSIDEKRRLLNTNRGF